jgi:hypothetical protein
MDKRHFTVVIGNKEHGLYVSSKPSSAAKKAVSKLCSSNKNKKVEFYLREITQGSKKKTYGLYVGEMKKLKKPIELKGRIIRYETKVQLKKDKSSTKMGKKMLGGGFRCGNEDETKTIGELCVQDEFGQYDNITNCESSCLEERLNIELDAWRKLFKWSSEVLPANHIYCKGGSALGLEVLKSILNVDPSKYPEFLSLNLIKDWDFTVLMTEAEKIAFIDYAKTLGIVNQGMTISILRYKKGLKIGDDYLLELSIKTTQELNDLELPLTNLKFEVNADNIELFFEIVKMYVKDEINFDKMKENLNILLNPVLVNGEDLVDSIKNGFYNITDPSKISTAGLSPILLDLIDKFLQTQNNANNANNANNINNQTIKQFLITQLSQPDRLFLRFFEKNKKKSEKITKFYEDNGIPLPIWLMNKRVLDKIDRKITLFLDFLNSYIESNLVIPEELLNASLDTIKPIKEIFKIFIDNMEILFKNINLTRLQNEKIGIKVRKLFPISVFPKIKKYALEKKEIKNKADLEKFKNRPNILSGKLASLEKERVNPQPFNYVFYLPSGNRNYLEFIRYFLNNIYNKSNNNKSN